MIDIIYDTSQNIGCTIICITCKVSFIHYPKEVPQKILNNKGPIIDLFDTLNKISVHELLVELILVRCFLFDR